MLAKFYADVLPQTGYFCLFDHNTKSHLWAESHQELIDLTKRYAHKPGIYFGTASYHSFANRKATNVRLLRSLRIDIDVAKASDPQRLRCYDTKGEALTAVVGFCKSAGMPPTYIISSGKGFHIYWCMDVDLAPAQWEPMALGLQQLGTRHGLKIDSSCTEDVTRILRPPDTIHHDDVRVSIKHASGHIWTVAQLNAKLVSDSVPAEVIQLTPTRVYDTSINREAIIEVVQRPPVSAIAVAAKCGALHYVASVKGDVQEPYWRAMLGLVKHTIEGDDLAHEWSSGHPDYDPDQTQKKIDGWSAGPTTCAEFANHTKACESCQYRGTVRSPVLLVNPPLPAVVAIPETVAHQAAAAVSPAVLVPLSLRLPPPPVTDRPWEGRIPPGFAVRALVPGPGYEMVAEIEDDEDPDTGRPIVKHVSFTNTIFWMGHWADSEGDDVARVQVYKLNPDGQIVTFTLDQDVVAVQRDLIRFLGGHRIQLTNHKGAPVAIHNYTRSALQQIEHTGRRLQISDHLGIRILPSGDIAATQGAHTIFSDGRIERSMLARKLEPVASQFAIPLPHAGKYGEWQPDVWPYIEERARMHVAFLRKHYGSAGLERFQLAIMMGLASPFMPFVEGKFQMGSVLPRGGLSVSLFSRESARGKTTAVQAAIMAFGDPAALTNDGGSLGATPNARVTRLSQHGTLPNIMDEMGSASPEDVADAVHMVANGAGRERGNQEGGLNIAAPFALINLITTNTSQRDMIVNVQESSDAIQRRLLEINVDGMPDHDRDQRHSFARDLTEMSANCIGALGAVIHREICKLGVAGVTELTMACVEKADRNTGAKTAQRFQYRGLGAVLALHVTLAKLGIEIFPLKGVFDAFMVAHDSGQDFIAQNITSTNGLEILSKMLHDFAPNTLVTEKETRLVSGRDDIQDKVLNDRVPDNVFVRHIKSTGRSYVSVDAAKAWCAKHKVQESEITKKGKEERVFETFEGTRRLPYTKYNLFKGMRTDTSSFIKCWVIDKSLLAQKLGLPMDDIVPAPNTAPVITNVVSIR